VDLLSYVKCGENRIAVELTASVECLGGYSNDCSCESSMLLAEVWTGETCILATDESWDALRLTQREQYSAKISHCRQNTEIYHLNADYTAWRTAGPEDGTLTECIWQKASICEANTPKLLPRRMPYATLEKQANARLTEAVGAYRDEKRPVPGIWFEKLYEDYYAKLTEFPVREYVQTVEEPLQGSAVRYKDGVCFSNIKNKQVCAAFDFGELRLGFLGVTIQCAAPCVVDLVHIESIPEYDIKGVCVGGANPVTRLYLPAGEWSFLTMEPALVRYTRIYLRAAEKDAPVPDCSFTDLHVREYCYPDRLSAEFLCSDHDVNRIYQAAYRTLRLNTLDIFMDCPERERGGWLCDSLWTARAAALVLGDSSVEKAFLENFLIAPYGDGVGSPNNFFPEVYPGAKLPGAPSITTWSFWGMLELVEYVERTGDIAFAKQYEQRVTDFVNGTQNYIGRFGLLQDMPFIFIDWSQSNAAENTAPICTAANALYAYMLVRLGSLYHRADWTALGHKMRTILRSTLLDEGNEADFHDYQFFPDTLIPDGDTLKKGGRFTESAQYVMLWSELFGKEELPSVTHEVLWAMGPAPRRPIDPQLGGAQMFIGLEVRLSLLSKWQENDQLLRELRALYLPMLTEGPGTLWEVRNMNNSSYCHGFNANACVMLLYNILGLDIPKVYDLETGMDILPEEQRNQVQGKADLVDLRWARGGVTLADGSLVTRIVRCEDDSVKYRTK